MSVNNDKCFCNECKSVLDEDDLVKYEEPSEAWGHTVYEDWWVCPNCGHVPVEYDYQDKTCTDCSLVGTDECPWGGERKTVCGDFLED